jgi:hypothetical protein
MSSDQRAVLRNVLRLDEPVGGETTTGHTTDNGAPWDSSLQATCECLSWRGVLDNLERRHAEDELGEREYASIDGPSKRVLVLAHLLLERKVIGQDELRAHVGSVRDRFDRTQ